MLEFFQICSCILFENLGDGISTSHPNQQCMPNVDSTQVKFKISPGSDVARNLHFCQKSRQVLSLKTQLCLVFISLDGGYPMAMGLLLLPGVSGI
jgi:hypothetical protein